jgi:hypothetical protein
MRKTSITIAALAALLALPAVAMGQGSVFPDNAALDQYVESVPGPTGKTPSGDASRGGGGGAGTRGGGAGGGAGATLPSGTVSALRALGSDGQAVADLAAATAPVKPQGSARQSQGSGGQGSGGGGDKGAGRSGEGADSAEASSGVGAIVGQTVGAGGEGGMGLLLPLILAAALLGALAAARAAVVRRRRGAGPPE